MTDVGGIAVDRLRSFFQRVERLDEEIAGLNDDKKELYAEMKGSGFDVAAFKAAYALLRKQAKDPTAFQEREAIVDLYLDAMSSGTNIATRAPVQAHEKPAGRSEEASATESGDALPMGAVGDELFVAVEGPSACWTVRHAGRPIYSAIAAEAFAADLCCELRTYAVEQRREPPPDEIAERVRLVLRQHTDVGVALLPPYDGSGADRKPYQPAGFVPADEKGRQARRGGEPIDDCPFDREKDQTRYHLWRSGWRDEDKAAAQRVAA